MARRRLEPGEVGKVRSWQVKQGRWKAEAGYRDHSGAAGTARISGRTESEARQALLAEIEERLNDLSDGTVETTTSVTDAVELYFTNRMADARAGIGRANPRSVRIYRSTAKNWIAPYLGDLAVRELTSGRLDRYFRRDVSASRYADVRKVLHAFIKWLIIQGVLQVDPVLNLPSYQRQTPHKRSKDREVTVADLQDALAAIDGWMTAKRPGPRPSLVYRDLVILIAATACRPGEALAVRREDVDLDFEVSPGVRKPVLHITGTIVYDAAEGGLFRQPHTKSNGAGDRTVVLPKFAAAMLRRRMLAVKPNEHDALFATKTGNWLSLNNINTRFREVILKDTAVAEWFELRQLRSATGTAVADEYGADAAAAQMGNTREIAESHYIHKAKLAPDRSDHIQDVWGGALDSMA